MSRRSRGPKRWSRRGSAKLDKARSHGRLAELVAVVLDMADAHGLTMTRAEARRRAARGMREFDRAMLTGGPVPAIVSLRGA